MKLSLFQMSVFCFIQVNLRVTPACSKDLATAEKSASDKLTAARLHKCYFIVKQKAPLANQFPHTETFSLNSLTDLMGLLNLSQHSDISL